MEARTLKRVHLQILKRRQGKGEGTVKIVFTLPGRFRISAALLRSGNREFPAAGRPPGTASPIASMLVDMKQVFL
jgi:hypothetical protein